MDDACRGSTSEEGKPRIAGHRIRVEDIVIWTEQGQSPDEIVADFPQLSLGDVHAALAYYFDHREEIRHDMEEDERFVAEMKARSGPGLLDRLLGNDRDADSLPSG